MTKYQWTKEHVEKALQECTRSGYRRYAEAFLRKVKNTGQSLTRTRFFELLEECTPPKGDQLDYMDYQIFLVNHFELSADFSEAWDISETQPLPRITTVAMLGDLPLPADFCTLGGAPEWIQAKDYPICKKCDTDMVLFLQLKSLPYTITKDREELRAYTFGDAGNFYVFQCSTCGAFKNSSDSY